MRILLVEDEASIRNTIKLNLELSDYEVVTAENGSEALDKVMSQHFDLLILDVMLPDMDGFQICEQIRLSDFETPIIFVTARNSGDDRIKGLKLGADDYLTKPFEFEELELRIGKLLQRAGKSTGDETSIYAFGNNRMNFKTFDAWGRNGAFTLTKKEAMLLKLLIDRKNQVVSRRQILQSVWGYDVFPSTRTIDNFILSFRKYFEEDPRNPKFFISVRGVGYKFVE
ncbi:MAG: response regulator transcription factor [Saprospiraceae bacterium]|nr:response regulator transcription factor [Saprospiraceae bacterium]MCB9323542.1 response regulator transcription factor [Lewinellaceae bacterium]